MDFRRQRYTARRANTAITPTDDRTVASPPATIHIATSAITSAGRAFSRARRLAVNVALKRVNLLRNLYAMRESPY